MSTCNLDKFVEYPLTAVQHDAATGKYQVRISNPPKECSDGFFTSKAATVTVDPNLAVSKLTYTNHPVILVPAKGIVQEIDSTPPSSFSGLGIFLVLALVAVGVWFVFFRNKNTPAAVTSGTSSPTDETAGVSSASSITANDSSPSAHRTATASPSYRPAVRPAPAFRPSYVPVSSAQPAPVPAPAPVIVNSGGGSGDLLTGMLIGNALSGGGHHDTTVIHEREVVHDGNTYSGDRPDSGNYVGDKTPRISSEDSNRSYQSDSGSNRYESDSSSNTSSSDDNSSDSSSSRYSSDDDSSSRYSSDSGSSSSYNSDSSSSSDSYSSDSGSSSSYDSGGSSDSGSSFSSD